jgi:hypothetical protein
MGLATGLVFVHPLSAFFGTTTVTWDASNCPAGVYTITALARATSDTQHYSVTTSNVSLPKATVVQQFSNLPSGSFQVSATAMSSNGETFQSQIETVTSNGSSGGGGTVVFGRSRPPSTPATGLAKSRSQPADPPPTPPNDPKLAPSAVPTNAPPPDASLRRSDAVLDPQVRRLLVLLADDSSGSDRQWRRVDVVDDDADGVADYVAVESISGEIWIYRFHGS